MDQEFNLFDTCEVAASLIERANQLLNLTERLFASWWDGILRKPLFA